MDDEVHFETESTSFSDDVTMVFEDEHGEPKVRLDSLGSYYLLMIKDNEVYMEKISSEGGYSPGIVDSGKVIELEILS